MMKLNKTQFLGIENEYTNPERAENIIIPFPYEGGVSYGRGTAQAPQAVLDASAYLELYDEILDSEPYRKGIATLAAPSIPKEPYKMIETLFNLCTPIVDSGKFCGVIGGDHSISSAFAKALFNRYGKLSVIQLDAHADLRDSYEGSPLSHASVMARIRDFTRETLQIGIRSMSAEEAQLWKKENLNLITMERFRKNEYDLIALLDKLPDPVFLTLDVDVFDWSVIRSTGTPEPGGMYWDEMMALLQTIFNNKNVVGFDVVELSHRKDDINSPFAAAKLIYKIIGFKQSGKIDAADK
jgi:agmatinase